MAKAEPVRPAGPGERHLYESVEAKFRRNSDFFRAVAERTGLTEETEKSAFYRIIRGEPGRQVNWRLRHYGAILHVPVRRFQSPKEEPEAEADGRLPDRNLSPREVRDALETLIRRVDRLVDQVERLERQRLPKNRQEESGP